MRTRALWLFPAVGILLASSPVQAIPVHQWSKGFGDADYQAGFSVATDGSGNVIVTGAFRGTVDFGGGPLTSAGDNDIFVAKFDADGNHLWSQGFGDDKSQYAASVAADGSENIAITGAFIGTVDFGGGPLTSAGGNDIFIAKFDTDGNHLWSQGFGDDKEQYAASVAVDGSNNVVVTGPFYGNVDFGGGPLTSVGDADIFVAKFDDGGNHLWSQRFGDGNRHQEGRWVAADGSGNVVITGYFDGTVDFGGGPLTSVGGADIFVAKFDANANHLWSQSFAGVDGQEVHSVAADGSGNVVITGWFTGTMDFGGGPLTSAGSSDIFVAKFDANGSHVWSQSFGDGNGQLGRSVTADGLGNVVVTGGFAGTVDFGGGPLTSGSLDPSDIFVAQFDASGNHVWSRGFGDISNQMGHSVAADRSGNVVVTGTFYGTVDFGGGPLTSVVDPNIFLAKFKEQPLPVLITSFEAKIRGSAVEITWDVWSDEALESFALYRRDDESPTPIVVAQSPFDHATRLYVDVNVEPGTTYRYELLIHTQNGDDIRSAIATVTVPTLETTLGQNFPNPFKPATTIEYTLSEQSSAVLGVYDAAGRLIVRLDQGVRDAGTYRAEWDGRGAGGRVVGSGVYFYRLEGAPGVVPKKMVLLK